MPRLCFSEEKKNIKRKTGLAFLDPVSHAST